MKSPIPNLVFAVFLWMVSSHSIAGSSDGEKNGIEVRVTKVTLSRADQRGTLLNTSIIDRLQGLKLVITNASFKTVPASSIEWKILIRKSGVSTVESYTGVEVLKSLQKAETVETTLGSVPILGARDGAVLAMDKMEWRISIKRDGAEIYGATSISGFEALEKRATPGAIQAAPPTAPATPIPATPVAPPALPPQAVAPNTAK